MAATRMKHLKSPAGKKPCICLRHPYKQRQSKRNETDLRRYQAWANHSIESIILVENKRALELETGAVQPTFWLALA